MYARQECAASDHECWRQSYISSVIAASASASASAASASAIPENNQKAQQDSSSTSDPNEGSARLSSTIGLESSTTVPVTAVASETTSFSDTTISGTSSTPFPDSSSLTLSGFRYPGMITQSRPWGGGGGPYRPSSTATAAASSFTDSSANSGPSPSAEAVNSGTRKTALIAGVVIPIILILAGGLLFLTCLRRRRRTAQATSSTAPSLLEKVSHKRLDSDAIVPIPITTVYEENRALAPQRLQNPHLMIPSTQPPSQNPTYFTGLDTFSMHSAATTEDPPPPYRTHSVLSNRSTEPQHFIPLAPLSPISPLTPQQEDLLSPFSDTHAVPPAVVTRSPSTRSFASTLYSSNASVYEARPARRSVGNAYMVPGLDVSPFADPEDGDGRL